MKYISNVKCPQCGHINTLKIPDNMWLMWINCQGCNEPIWGHENPHGWNWVFCSYGDVPWRKIQEQEESNKNIEWHPSKNAREGLTKGLPPFNSKNNIEQILSIIITNFPYGNYIRGIK